MMKSRSSIQGFVWSLAIGILLSTIPAQAQDAYVSAREFDLLGNATNRLGIMNLATGNIQTIGTLPFGFFGLQLVGNTLYGVHEGGALYSINTATAATTFIKQVDDANGGLPVPGTLALGTDGTVYNYQNRTGLAPSTAHIYTININGSSTSVAPLSSLNVVTPGEPTPGNTGIIGNGGLAFDPTSGLLYGSQGDMGDGIFSVNPTTGAVTTVTANSGFVAGNFVYSLFYDTNANSMYAIDNPSGATGTVYTVDKATGLATVVTTYNSVGFGKIESAAFIAAPEPGSGALMLLAVGTSAVLVRRRRKS